MKNIIYIVVIAVVIAALAGIYFVFLRPQPSVPSDVAQQRQELLPYGTAFNTSALTTPDLQNLQTIGTIGDVNGSGNTHPFGK